MTQSPAATAAPARVAVLVNPPSRGDAAAWNPAAWEAAAGPIVAQALGLSVAQAIVPHAPGVGMAVAAGLARAGVAVLLVQPYKGCTVAGRDGSRAYRTWDSYWHGECAAYNAALLALPGVTAWSPAGDQDVAAPHRDAAKEAAYRAVGRAATHVIAAEGSDPLRAVAVATAAGRGVLPLAPWTALPVAPAEKPKRKRAARKAAPALPEDAPF